MNNSNQYLEFITSLDNMFEEISSIINFLLQNDIRNTIDIHSLLLYLSLLDRLLTCLNQDFQSII